MYFKNYDNTIHFEIMVRVAKAFHSEDFEAAVDRIPQEMRPRSQKSSRCCIYRDRAIIKYRCMATLGFAIENEDNELKPLSAYAHEALNRERLSGNMITFIDEACNGCVRTHYEATSACRGCLAEACVQHCPKDAVQVVNGKSVIDPDKCIKCGKCMDACPYHAIVYIPIPCEESCPTGAISKDVSGKEVIDYGKCIFCGKCMAACPFTAVLERSQMIDVMQGLKKKQSMVAMIAPAIAGEFNASMKQLATALRRIGFADVVEVAAGADITARLEANEFIERMEHGAPFMTTSCCPAYTELVRKHIPELGPFVSDTRTPMHYTAQMVKEQDDNSCTVFVGPCVAKRHEGTNDELVDYVLTFQELEAMFQAQGVVISECEESEFGIAGCREGRSFPVSGGVTAGIRSMINERAEILQPTIVDGLNSKSLKELKKFVKQGAPGNFVEVMGCEGGCVAGPATIVPARKATKKCTDYASSSPSALCAERAAD
ncbi:4Fe-4S dicluster domain-containing protein [Desulfovibrio mangrovi]|uniref:4Fe-4S dicluster domain-containing protein n=1 Tax=Desulfovibrio mangrovi TaxID=2976983 RepID=UPI002246F7C4|nr:4Fe-4S dicluster domain-containing protein [Desulfovibrio mangrovi]UZP68949.1 4Fe-4S dicluster domain-containing protein [Desulfovibrio mangrovi]